LFRRCLFGRDFVRQALPSMAHRWFLGSDRDGRNFVWIKS
jgi:hypothetical protein